MLPIRDKYLVFGGHGWVGRVVCQYLAAKSSGRVVAAGRSANAAADFEYHHFQAVAALDSCNPEQAQTHATTANTESAAAHKCSMTAAQHSHKAPIATV